MSHHYSQVKTIDHSREETSVGKRSINDILSNFKKEKEQFNHKLT